MLAIVIIGWQPLALRSQLGKSPFGLGSSFFALESMRVSALLETRVTAHSLGSLLCTLTPSACGWRDDPVLSRVTMVGVIRICWQYRPTSIMSRNSNELPKSGIKGMLEGASLS